jgi:tetratricopeptide (TPR) repeat protein
MTKKILKWGLIIFLVSGAAFIAFNFFLSFKKKDCLEGKGQQAIEACTFLINGHTSSYRAEYLIRRAELLEKENRLDEVIADLNEVISLRSLAQVTPERVVAAYGSLVRLNYKKGDLAEVRKYLELAVQNGSKEPEIYVSLAGIYVEEKKYQEALNLLETAGGFEQAKKHPYYNAQASAYEGLNDYKKAYAALKTGLTVPAPRPVLAATSKHLGLVCFELKSYKEAELYLNYSLKAGLDCPECALLLTTIRGALEPSEEPVRRVRRPRN